MLFKSIVCKSINVYKVIYINNKLRVYMCYLYMLIIN